MQNIISLDTEKLARRGFQHDGPAPPHTHTHWRNTGGLGPSPPPRPVPTPMNLSKHLLTNWLGVSTVELCGWKKRDLGGILTYVQAQKWGGGRRPPSAPPPWKVGGRAAPCPPPCSYAYVIIVKCGPVGSILGFALLYKHNLTHVVWKWLEVVTLPVCL